VAGDFERRLLEVERRLGNAGLGLERTRLRTLQGLQEARQLWSDLSSVAPPPAVPCGTLTRIIGQVGGCPSTTGPATVTAMLGAFSASVGAANSVDYSIDVTTGGAGTYTVAVAPNTARYLTPAPTTATVACGTTTRADFSLAPAAGYHCMSPTTNCDVPLKDSLVLTCHTTAPTATLTTTLTYNGSVWTADQDIPATVLLMSPGCAGTTCTGVLQHGGTYRVTWTFDGLTLSAYSWSCNVTGGGNVVVAVGGLGATPCVARAITLTFVSRTCPPAFGYSASHAGSNTTLTGTVGLVESP
jgi:hypothetical protein